MTTAEMLFGTETQRLANTRIAAYLGRSEAAVRNWRKNPDLIPWGDMKKLVRLRGLTDKDLAKMAKEKNY